MKTGTDEAWWEARNRLGVVEQLGKTGTNETGRAASEDRSR